MSRLSNEQYERARKATAPMLGFGRAVALDKARAARIAERQATQEGDEEEEEVWPDPITDIGEVLDDAVVEVSRYIKASREAIDTVVLWSAGAHIQQRGDLHINIAPRIYVTSPVPGCGKTLLLEIVAELTPRALMLSSTSVAGLFREIEASKPTLLFDEFDKQMAGASQEHQGILNSGHRKTSAFVLRAAKTEDGQIVREKFSTFTAMAFSGIKKLDDAMTSRCIIVALQRAGADDELEHLVDGSSDKLVEIRRKLARWAKDLVDLPMVDRPKTLANRLGDNWFVVRRIAKLAGEAWEKRAMAAATTPAMTRDTNLTLAVLDAVWRVFDGTKRQRMHTKDLLAELLDMDEGKWREANQGKAITEWFLRDSFGDMLPANAEEIAPRRWREGQGNQLNGYDVRHFEGAFQRYLGKKLPSRTAEGDSARNAHKTSNTSNTSDTGTVNADISETCEVSDTLGASDTKPRPSDTKPRPSDTEPESRPPVLDAPGFVSDAQNRSGTEKSEENEGTPGDVSDVSDVSDEKASTRARVSEGRGAVGRRARKGGT